MVKASVTMNFSGVDREAFDLITGGIIPHLPTDDDAFGVPWRLSDLLTLPQNAPRVISTFSCGGGSSMGYRLAGCRVIASVDIDPKMTELYGRNLPTPQVITAPVGDLLTPAYADQVMQWREMEIEILDGSPPCTVFSTAGKTTKKWGKEIHFTEGATKQVLDRLFFDYLDLVDAVRPKMFIAENVKGMLVGPARGYTKLVVEKARELGYDVQVLLLDAAGYGVPQHRERVFFVGRRRDLDLPPVVAPAPRSDLITVRQAFADLPSPPTNDRVWQLPNVHQAVWNNLVPGQTGKTYYGETRGRPSSGYGIVKLHPDHPATTLATRQTSLHWSEKRYLSAAEFLRIGSFPDDYDLDLDGKPRIWPIYVVGMSVPPRLMQAVAAAARVSLGQ